MTDATTVLLSYIMFLQWVPQDQVKQVSDSNTKVKKNNTVPVVCAEVSKAHNYSTQTLNSTQLANEALQKVLQEVSLNVDM